MAGDMSLSVHVHVGSFIESIEHEPSYMWYVQYFLTIDRRHADWMHMTGVLLDWETEGKLHAGRTAALAIFRWASWFLR